MLPPIQSFTKAKRARERFQQLLKDKNVKNNDELQKLQKGGTGLKSIDETWQIESGMVDMVAGNAAELFAEVRLGKVLPDAHQLIGLDASIASMEQIITSQATKVAPAAVQAVQLYILKQLKLLQADKAPNFDKVRTNALTGKLSARFQYFATCEMDGGKQLCGQEAVDHLCKVAETKFKSRTLHQSDLATITKFKWMLTNEWARKYQQWKDAAVAPIEPKAKPKAKAKAACKLDDKALKVAADMFK